ncbi:MAG: riboflavin synthase subunit alpha [Gammaproteobacteria bacterium]|nr:riboflavin synthase subunit alpha [Gammaproteobacteria bacterium]
MYTGIAHGKYRAHVKQQQDGILKLTIDLGSYGQDLAIGASVAVNGVCLTVVSNSNGIASFDIGTETARISNLGELNDGSYVNVERSFRVGDEVGGHILSGHVADVVRVESNTHHGSESLLEFVVPEAWRQYVMPKGFVALNGCSLTVAEFDRESGVGSINLIPETLRRTTFRDVAKGDRLNLEVDSQTQAVVDTVRAVMTDKNWIQSIQ